MTLIQYKTFQYFWDGAEPTSGARAKDFTPTATILITIRT